MSELKSGRANLVGMYILFIDILGVRNSRTYYMLTNKENFSQTLVWFKDMMAAIGVFAESVRIWIRRNDCKSND